jgi:acetoacetate decarboxylase
MNIDDVRQRAFAIPLTSPAFSPGPYRFFDREYLIMTYRTDPAVLEAVLPAPLTFDEPLVKYKFIRMPDSTGFGDYTESGQVIPVKLEGQEGNYTPRDVPQRWTLRSMAAANCGGSPRNMPSRRLARTRTR